MLWPWSVHTVGLPGRIRTPWPGTDPDAPDEGSAFGKSRRPVPLLPARGNRLPRRPYRILLVVVRDNEHLAVTWPSFRPVPSTATAVWLRMCGSIPMMTANALVSLYFQ